jgi:hypothetical protein
LLAIEITSSFSVHDDVCAVSEKPEDKQAKETCLQLCFRVGFEVAIMHCGRHAVVGNRSTPLWFKANAAVATQGAFRERQQAPPPPGGASKDGCHVRMLPTS